MYYQLPKAALLGWVLLGVATTVSARCKCSDVRPRFSHDGPPVPFGCYDQRRFGKCDEPFMFETIEELAAGYCQISCGRCDCCSTFKELALSLGLGEMLEMMDLIGLDPFEIQENPAWMASVLAPQPGAFSNWLSVQGWTNESVAATTAQQSILKETIMLHILPPVEPIVALWTTPFFQTGTEIKTSSKSFPTVFGYMDSFSTGISGDLNSVTIVNGNQEFCKGFIHVVSDVLLAYPLQIPPPPPPIDENQMVGNSTSNNSTNAIVEADSGRNVTESIVPEASPQTSPSSNLTNVEISSPPGDTLITNGTAQSFSPGAPSVASISSDQTEIASPASFGGASTTGSEANSTSAEAPAEMSVGGNQSNTINPEGTASSDSTGGTFDSTSSVSNSGAESSSPEISPEPTEAPVPVSKEEAPAAASGDSGAASVNSKSASNFLG